MSPSSRTTVGTAPTSGRGTSTRTTTSAIPTRASGAHIQPNAANQFGAALLNRESHRAQSPHHEAGSVVASKDAIENSVGGRTSGHRMWEQIISVDNCRSAIIEECRTPRFKRGGFADRLLANLDELAPRVSEMLRNGVKPEPPTEFDIFEYGKKRHIETPSKRDSILIRAIVRVVEPHIYKRMTAHSYCPVPGRGGLRLAQNLKQGLRSAEHICAKHNERHPKGTQWQVYALKSDIRKFFPSLTFNVIVEALAKYVSDQQVISSIVNFIGFKDGLPIGAGYSAMLANAVLIDTDFAMEHVNGCLGYYRYMDDVVMLFKSRSKAKDAAAQLSTRLSALGLSIDGKWRIIETRRNPICIGGFKVRKDSIHMGRRSARHLIRLMRRPYRNLSDNAKRAADSLYGYIKRTDSFNFKCKWRKFK